MTKTGGRRAALGRTAIFVMAASGFALVRPLPAARAAPKAEPTPIAAAGFSFDDTSGEPRDQTAEHRARLSAFLQTLEAELGSKGKYRIVRLDCPYGPCSVVGSNPAELLDSARRAGAKLLLIGGVHKVSTLVEWLKAEVVDVAADKLVYDRLVTFRGDNDMAWQHAAEFLVRELDDGGPTR